LAEQLNRVELLRLARLGASARLEELRREIVSLETLLGGDAPRENRPAPRRKTARVAPVAKVAPAAKAAPAAVAEASDAAKTAWSPAARKAVSLRMKKYWAARRQAKK
jgi:hypothetical protein